MLVCHVSSRPRRSAIVAAIAEIATANDAATTGQVVFATLVDDPASVRETVDAYLGQIMKEAASAAATVNAGLVYAAGISEAASANSTQNGAVPTIWTATVAEAETASSVQDAAGISALPYARMLGASRPGLGSVAASDSGKTQVISNIGVVT